VTSPLIERLTIELGYPELDCDTVDEFTARHESCVLFFTEDPKAFQESNDVAVILPELVGAFDGRLVAAVVSRDAERILMKRYGITAWPTLVFLRHGAYLGAISRVQDWDYYLERIEAILAARPGKPPGVGIPVEGSAAPGGCTGSCQ